MNLQNQNSATPGQNGQSQPVAGVSHFDVQSNLSGLKVKEQNGDTICNLLKLIGEAYKLQSVYQCAEAEQQYKRLTNKQKETGWVQGQIARCLFEQARYQEALNAFEKMTKIEPHRLEGFEYYSTCLWYLKKQHELAHLSNFALEKSLFAPETWCVVGNCYSLQKEHETALKFFSRAIQLN